MKLHQFDDEHFSQFKKLLQLLKTRKTSAAMHHHSRLKKCAGPDWGYRFRCRLQSCPRCRDMYIRSQAKKAQHRFGNLSNDRLAMVSIVLGATTGVNEIGGNRRQGTSRPSESR